MVSLSLTLRELLTLSHRGQEHGGVPPNGGASPLRLNKSGGLKKLACLTGELLWRKEPICWLPPLLLTLDEGEG